MDCSSSPSDGHRTAAGRHRQRFSRLSVAAVPIFGSTQTMSSSNHNNGANGTITLKSFAELASVLDLDSLPPGPVGGQDADTSGAVDDKLAGDAVFESDSMREPDRSTIEPLDVASV